MKEIAIIWTGTLALIVMTALVGAWLKWGYDIFVKNKP